MSLLEMKHFLWSLGAPGSVWHVICLLTPWGKSREKLWPPLPGMTAPMMLAGGS